MPARNFSPRARLTVIFIGLLIICCALVALGYVFWPLPDSEFQATLPATLLTPP
jgi:uncharacterized membrane protein